MRDKSLNGAGPGSHLKRLCPIPTAESNFEIQPLFSFQNRASHYRHVSCNGWTVACPLFLARDSCAHLSTPRTWWDPLQLSTSFYIYTPSNPLLFFKAQTNINPNPRSVTLRSGSLSLSLFAMAKFSFSAVMTVIFFFAAAVAMAQEADLSAPAPSPSPLTGGASGLAMSAGVLCFSAVVSLLAPYLFSHWVFLCFFFHCFLMERD